MKLEKFIKIPLPPCYTTGTHYIEKDYNVIVKDENQMQESKYVNKRMKTLILKINLIKRRKQQSVLSK